MLKAHFSPIVHEKATGLHAAQKTCARGRLSIVEYFFKTDKKKHL